MRPEHQAVADEAVNRFAERVRELRRERGWSQEKLAEEADLHRTYIGGIERGLRNVSLWNIARLAHALSVPIAELFPTIRPLSRRLKR
ncbi:MAG: helix-turn-helix transcriptional regulator [Acidobacteria bacterium]|nr:helix-turn-helix transcriptional regulator [Acidobacteriota bacterium]